MRSGPPARLLTLPSCLSREGECVLRVTWGQGQERRSRRNEASVAGQDARRSEAGRMPEEPSLGAQPDRLRETATQRLLCREVGGAALASRPQTAAVLGAGSHPDAHL